MKNFNDWNIVKKETQEISKKVYFKDRDIFWTKVGEKIILNIIANSFRGQLNAKV